MSNILHKKYTFNRGLLQIQFTLDDVYSEAGCEITFIDFYEYDVDAADYVSIDTNQIISDTTNHIYEVYVANPSNDHNNHLVKIQITVTPANGVNVPCCATIDENNNWIMTEYCVDTHAMATKILNDLNFSCPDACEISCATVNPLLKMFAVQAAVDNDDPQLENIFTKLASNSKKTYSLTHTPCGCNG